MSEPEAALHDQREWLRVTLSSIGDAVITTDTSGNITFLNPVAQSLTGWTLEQETGVPLHDVFNIVNEETRRTVENPATRALREGLVVGLSHVRKVMHEAKGDAMRGKSSASDADRRGSGPTRG
jgi:PAS domain S-box-containing protein